MNIILHKLLQIHNIYSMIGLNSKYGRLESCVVKADFHGGGRKVVADISLQYLALGGKGLTFTMASRL
jgi:hypothetical protein